MKGGLVKAALFVLVCSALGGCRTSRLGDQQVVRAAFAAQAQQRAVPPAELDAADAHAIMARHREPLAPAQAGVAPAGARVLEGPQLGSPTP